MIDLESDLDLIFENGDFDTAAVFTVTAGTVTVRGWLTEATHQINALTSEIEAVLPSFTTKASGIATVKRGNGVVIDTVSYTVERMEKIGNGVTLVWLKT